MRKRVMVKKKRKNTMFLVLDYDDTYTAAPLFWDNFIESAKVNGHTIVCCT